MPQIVGFSKPIKNKIIPKLIMKLDKTNFSHAYLRLFSKSTDRHLIYQASGLQVNFVGSILFYKYNVPVYEFTIYITDRQRLELLQKLIDNAGKPYGIKQLIGLGFVRVLGFFGKKIKNPFADGDHTFICSELVAKMLIELGYKFEDLDNISPKDIYEALQNGQNIEK